MKNLSAAQLVAVQAAGCQGRGGLPAWSPRVQLAGHSEVCPTGYGLQALISLTQSSVSGPFHVSSALWCKACRVWSKVSRSEFVPCPLLASLKSLSFTFSSLEKWGCFLVDGVINICTYLVHRFQYTSTPVIISGSWIFRGWAVLLSFLFYSSCFF